ncbi:hypothetical protein BDN70DRAFT_937348 [Pholiota conissans]|uniref:Uncharacterized protein n=1 Tax=Pholiota conissans TaxID=109636 RepID=A0A9P6CP49_9AGAR|nr:hypothetical protein BDN70DRAFT_937348 [Pholiota conissans]
MSNSDSQDDGHNNRFFDPLLPATARVVCPVEYPASPTNIIPTFIASERTFCGSSLIPPSPPQSRAHSEATSASGYGPAPADISISDLYVGAEVEGEYQRHSIFRVYNALHLRGGKAIIIDKGDPDALEKDCTLAPLVYEPFVNHTEGKAIASLFRLLATAALCLDVYNLLNGSILSAAKVLEVVLPIIIPANTLTYTFILATATIKTFIGYSDDSYISDQCPIRPNRKDHPLAYFMAIEVQFLLKQTRTNRAAAMRKRARGILSNGKPFCGHSIERGFVVYRKENAEKILDTLFGPPMETDENNINSRRHHISIDRMATLYQSPATYDMVATFLQETVGPELLLASLQQQEHAKLPLSVVAFPVVFLVSELDSICASIHTNGYQVVLSGRQADLSSNEVYDLGMHAHLLGHISPKSPHAALLEVARRRMQYGAGLPTSPT